MSFDKNRKNFCIFADRKRKDTKFSTKRMERYFALYPGDEVKAICHYECNLMLWNLARVEEIHADMLKVIGWMNRDLPEWVKAQERFETVCDEIRRRMDWQ